MKTKLFTIRSTGGRRERRGEERPRQSQSLLPLLPPVKTIVWSALLAALPLQAATPLTPAFDVTRVTAFTEKYCSSCHNEADKEGGLDLTALEFAPQNGSNF